MTDREKELERRLVKCQRLWIESENGHSKTRALLALANFEILRLEFGVDLKEDEPELYEDVERMSRE